ncbi:MAG: alpha/beta hydrolase [Candidatus Nomurabacteria bacterium]|jgi:pimeloyl-ACP methyl ester carboxylesterase|nr:alpha/beta hydrolase [Candidatus Nomurabacteria bacterium]
MFDKLVHKFFGLPYKLAVPVDVRRKDERATLVFLHGVAASSKTWADLVKQLRKDDAFQNVRLVSIDLLGFGKSPAPSWSRYGVQDQIRAIKRTIGSLGVKSPFHLVGHSMGSLLATEYAAAYGEVESLVLVSPPFMTPAEQRIPSDVLYAAMLDNLRKAAQSKGGKKLVGVVEKFSSFEARYADTPAFRRSMDNVVLKGRAWHEVQHLGIPVLMIHGTFDSVVSRANLVKLAKHRHITLAESANGHSVSPRRVPFVVQQLKNVAKG